MGGASIGRGKQPWQFAVAVVPVISVSSVAATVAGRVADWPGRRGPSRLVVQLFALASDMVHECAVAWVVGLGGFARGVGGMLIADAVGHILRWTHSNVLPLVIAGSAYLIALLILHVFGPKLVPLQVDISGR